MHSPLSSIYFSHVKNWKLKCSQLYAIWTHDHRTTEDLWTLLKHQKQMLASSADSFCINLMTSEMTLNGTFKMRPSTRNDGWWMSRCNHMELISLYSVTGSRVIYKKKDFEKQSFPTPSALMAFVISLVLGHSPMVVRVTQYRTTRDTWHVRRDIDIGDIWQNDMLPSLCHSKRLDSLIGTIQTHSD